jgi:thymidylate kinase
MLRPYQLRGTASAEVFRVFAFVRRLLEHAGCGVKGVALSPQGALVAFMGPEGSGKSTLVAGTGRWLGQALRVRTIHAGKPPASVVTLVTRPFLPLLRMIAPRSRTTMFDAQRSNRRPSKRGVGFCLYAVRCVALAYDRAKLLGRAERLRRKGVIVICDRYPLHGELPDGWQLDERELAEQGNRFGSVLARMERALYSRVPTPDAVIACQVPLELALERNRTRNNRGGAEPESLVRRRHTQFSNVSLQLEAYQVRTDRPLDATLSTVRQLVWAAIVTNRTGLGSSTADHGRETARPSSVMKGPI